MLSKSDHHLLLYKIHKISPEVHREDATTGTDTHLYCAYMKKNITAQTAWLVSFGDGVTVIIDTLGLFQAITRGPDHPPLLPEKREDMMRVGARGPAVPQEDIMVQISLIHRLPRGYL